MLISIIITNYNYASFIGKAIDSALAQTYAPVEIIVVDDGSKDNSKEVINSYQDRVRPVYKANGGLGSAYNAGWSEAKGDIVFFLDADDALLPEAVAKCAAALEATNAIKAQFMLQKIDKDGNNIDGMMPTYGLRPSDISKDMEQWGYYLSPPASGNAYRRSFLDTVMPVPEMPRATHLYDLPADGYLCGLAGLMGPIVTIYEILGLYRVHGSNMSDAGKVETVNKLRQLFMIDYLREEYQEKWAKKLGLSCKHDRSRFHPTVCKQRFLAYRLQPSDHPVQEDTYLGLLLSGLWGAVRFPYITLKKRAFIFGGFIAIGILPRSALKKMINAVTKPEKRKNLIGFLKGST